MLPVPSMSDAGQRPSSGHRSPGIGGDFDPHEIPVRHAATVLILDERPNLQVLMLKRNARSVFVGDMWVFPGGAVDPGDASIEADTAVDNLTDTEASAALGLPAGGIAFWVAVLRETFEEAGILLAHSIGQDALVNLSEPATERRFSVHRDGVNNGSVDFIDMVQQEALHLDGSGVHYVARWVTPVGPPRRYDTRFFVTSMPAGQTPLHDNDEAVHHQWFSPQEALQANGADEMLMMTPTVSMLQRLGRFGSVEEALRAASSASAKDDEMVRIRFGTEGPNRIAYPGDLDYQEADATTEDGLLRWPPPA